MKNKNKNWITFPLHLQAATATCRRRCRPCAQVDLSALWPFLPPPSTPRKTASARWWPTSRQPTSASLVCCFALLLRVFVCVFFVCLCASPCASPCVCVLVRVLVHVLVRVFFCVSECLSVCFSVCLCARLCICMCFCPCASVLFHVLVSGFVRVLVRLNSDFVFQWWPCVSMMAVLCMLMWWLFPVE